MELLAQGLRFVANYAQNVPPLSNWMCTTTGMVERLELNTGIPVNIKLMILSTVLLCCHRMNGPVGQRNEIY